MPRTHGYSSRGERCFGQHDWHKKGRTNALGAWLNGLLLTVWLVNCTVDTDVFLAWFTHDLWPKVAPGTVIVMDNASFHMHPHIREAAQAHGCILEYLPPYSPDLNPIEKLWAQLKAIRRQMACSIDELFQTFMVSQNEGL